MIARIVPAGAEEGRLLRMRGTFFMETHRS
jgi:hypothetical protein